MQTTDSTCIKRILDGDKNAFGILIDRYQDKAYHLAIKMLRNNDEACDCVQEAFIKAYEHLPGFRKEAKFSTWFFQIVYHSAISRIRYARRMVSSDEWNDNMWDSAKANVLFEEMDLQELRKMLNRAYQTLQSEEVFILEQYYREECSLKELAEMTGLTPGNIKVKLYRARKKMYLRMQQLYKEELELWNIK